MPRFLLLHLTFVLGLVAGCGETISLGPVDVPADAGGADAGTGGGSASCDGKACGTPCPLVDQQPKFGYCDGQGVCSPSYLCDPYQPCLGLFCGDACKPCDPRTDEPCPLPPDEYYSCDETGACLPGGAACPPCKNGEPYCPYNTCLGQPCGTPCKVCDPKDPGCVEPMEPAVCSASGECLPQSSAYCDPCSDPSTFASFPCGTPCDYCMYQPWDASCAPSPYLYLCDGFGACNPPEYANCSPSYQPCADKQCGDPCSVCDPSDKANCYQGLELLYCNGDGTCSESVSCPALDCMGAACGMQCQMCAQNNMSCSPMFCDGLGNCTSAGSVQCGSYLPCQGAVCGTPCTLCDTQPCDESTFLACDGYGACTDQPLCYTPCGGKTCGAPCTICQQGDMSCLEPDPQTKQCDSSGQCTGAPVMCL